MIVKRIISIGLVLLLSLSVTACSSKNEGSNSGTNSSITNVVADPTKPEGTVKIVFDAFKKKDLDTLNQYAKVNIAGKSGSINSLLSSENNKLLMGSNDPEAVALMNGFTEDFSYKILESKTDGNEATVKVQVTNRDLSKVVNGLVAAGDTQSSDETLLVQLIDDAKGKTVTTEIKLPVSKNGDKWIVNLDTSAVNAIFGKIMSADWTSLIKDATQKN